MPETISFECPKCRKRLRVPVKFAGQAGRCTECGAQIVAPSAIQPPPHKEKPSNTHPRGDQSWLDTCRSAICEMVVLMNYRDHYAEAFSTLSESYRSRLIVELSTPRVLAELYLFRGWTTQFGYRLFIKDESASERLIGEVVNLTYRMGLPMIRATHGFSIEEVLGAEYPSLLEDRWQRYDRVIPMKFREELPTLKIVDVLTQCIAVKNLRDPRAEVCLSVDFLKHLESIKSTVSSLGMNL